MTIPVVLHHHAIDGDDAVQLHPRERTDLTDLEVVPLAERLVGELRRKTFVRLVVPETTTALVGAKIPLAAGFGEIDTGTCGLPRR